MLFVEPILHLPPPFGWADILVIMNDEESTTRSVRSVLSIHHDVASVLNITLRISLVEKPVIRASCQIHVFKEHGERLVDRDDGKNIVDPFGQGDENSRTEHPRIPPTNEYPVRRVYASRNDSPSDIRFRSIMTLERNGMAARDILRSTYSSKFTRWRSH